MAIGSRRLWECGEGRGVWRRGEEWRIFIVGGVVVAVLVWERHLEGCSGGITAYLEDGVSKERILDLSRENQVCVLRRTSLNWTQGTIYRNTERDIGVPIDQNQ